MAALLACGLIAAGCGDDDEDSADDSPATTESAPADTTATEETDTTATEDDSGGTGAGDVDNVDEAVEACKEGVESSAGSLSEDLQNDLKDICEQAASGDEEDLQDATREICRRIVEETVPEGSARDQGLEACDTAAQ